MIIRIIHRDKISYAGVISYLNVLTSHDRGALINKYSFSDFESRAGNGTKLTTCNVPPQGEATPHQDSTSAMQGW